MSTDKPQKKDWSRRNWVAKHADKYNKAQVHRDRTEPVRKPKHQRPIHELDPDDYEDWLDEGT